MKASAVRPTIIAVVFAIVGATVAVLSGQALESRRPSMPEGYQDQDLTVQGARLKGFVLGADGLVADWYWMRSLQYLGDKLIAADIAKKDVNLDDLRNLDPRLLYPYLDNATTLDPKFIAAYSYGAMVLPAIDKDNAIAIAQKGIANNLSEWRLYQHLGYIYWKLGRYDESAATYDSGSRIEGAAPFMKLMAAVMKTEGGSRATAYQIYSQMLAEAQDEQTALTAKRRLLQLDSLYERDAIDSALKQFSEKNGRCVGDLREINPLLASVKLANGKQFRIDGQNRIVDPTDVPYILDREVCKTKLDVEKTGIALD